MSGPPLFIGRLTALPSADPLLPGAGVPLQRLTQMPIPRGPGRPPCSAGVCTTTPVAMVVSTRARRAHDLLAGIEAGATLHIASRGELSLHDVLAVLARLYGPFNCLTLATWAAGLDAVRGLLAIRDGRDVDRLEVLCDVRLPRESPQSHTLLARSADLYGTSPCHAKVAAFTGERAGLVCLGSANLTYNPRCEAIAITRDLAVARFHAGWIREELTHARSRCRQP